MINEKDKKQEEDSFLKRLWNKVKSWLPIILFVILLSFVGNHFLRQGSKALAKLTAAMWAPERVPYVAGMLAIIPWLSPPMGALYVIFTMLMFIPRFTPDVFFYNTVRVVATTATAVLIFSAATINPLLAGIMVLIGILGFMFSSPGGGMLRLTTASSTPSVSSAAASAASVVASAEAAAVASAEAAADAASAAAAEAAALVASSVKSVASAASSAASSVKSAASSVASPGAGVGFK